MLDINLNYNNFIYEKPVIKNPKEITSMIKAKLSPLNMLKIETNVFTRKDCIVGNLIIVRRYSQLIEIRTKIFNSEKPKTE